MWRKNDVVYDLHVGSGRRRKRTRRLRLDKGSVVFQKEGDRLSKQLTDAKRRAIQKYDAKNTKQIHLKLNLNTDADILEQLERVDNVQGYIKDLIRKDMNPV